MRHTWLLLGSGDALVGWLQILVCLSLKLSLVILGEVLSPPTPCSTLSQQVQYYSGVPVGKCRLSVVGHVVLRGACGFS